MQRNFSFRFLEQVVPEKKTAVKSTVHSSWVQRSSLTSQCSTGRFEELHLAAFVTIKKRVSSALAALPLQSCGQINTDINGLSTAVNIKIRKPLNSIGSDLLPSAIPHHLSLKVALKHQKIEGKTNVIMSWQVTIIFYYDIQFILPNYVGTH